MSSILEQISGMLGDNELDQISQKIGADKSQTQNAIASALPALLGGLSRKADADDAEDTFGQWDNDNDDGMLDNVSNFFGGSNESRGEGMLSQIFGNKRERVEQTVGKSSGLTGGQSGMLMKMLAPMVMGSLFRQKKQQNMSSGGLFDLIRGENKQVEQKSGGMIGRMLDQDGDGDFDLGDIGKMAMGMFFKR